MTAAPDLVARPASVLLAAEAKARGFKSTVAFRRWCQRRGVPIAKPGGKQEWVRPIDVDAAVARTFAPPTPSTDGVARTIAILKSAR